MGLKYMFSSQPLMTFTVEQMKAHIIRGYPWLANPTPKQNELLSKIIKTGIQKLVQSNRVKKVHSKLSTDAQWQATLGLLQNEGFVNITSEDSVAHTPEAEKAIQQRAVGGRTLHRLNNLTPGKA